MNKHKSIQKKTFAVIIISLLFIISFSSINSADFETEKYEKEDYETQASTPSINSYYISPDWNGCSVIFISNQSDSHLRMAFAKNESFNDSVYYWDNTSIDIGGGEYRYDSSDMANALTPNAKYYYNFTIMNGTDTSFNQSTNYSIRLWDLNITLENPSDRTYEQIPNSPVYLNVTVNSTIGSKFNVTWYSGYYFDATYLTQQNYSNNATLSHAWMNVTEYGKKYLWCIKAETCYPRALPDNGEERVRDTFTKERGGWGERNNWTFWTQNDTITFTLVEPLNISISDVEEVNITWNISTKGTRINITEVTTGNGTFTTTNTSWVSEYGTDYTWVVCVNETGSIHWRNLSFLFRTEEDPLENWILKPGYDNCTYGVPDFDQKQDEWRNPVDGNWVYCGPTALADCLWWLDCKYNNITKDYFIPDWCGKGSKHPDNVYYLINITAQFVNTTKAEAADEPSGTLAENFTHGIWNIFEHYGLNGTFFNLTMEGYTFGENWDEESVNYTNITEQIDNCSDVLLLLGFWCEVPGGGWQRIGGHYVQCNGYNSDNWTLSLSDPYKDSAEEGNWGWKSPHTVHPNFNGSHNNTDNVSYDFYYVSYMPPAFSGFANFIQLDNYLDDMGNISENWSKQNRYDNVQNYEPEGQTCVNMAAVVEIAWYIEGPQNCNVSINKKVWNGSAWVVNYTNPEVGSTITTNISVQNFGGEVRSLYLADSYTDAFLYQSGTSVIHLPDGTSYSRPPNSTYVCSGETCEEAQHGGMYWYLNYSEGHLDFGETLYIHTNWTVNNSRYSYNTVNGYACTENDSCFWPNVSCSLDTVSCYINERINTSIECNINYTENSTWLVSEYVHRNCTENPCLDERWKEYESEFGKWFSTSTGEERYNWVYRYSDADGSGGDHLGLSYTIAENSSSNRSQIISFLRNSYVPTDDNESFIGIIYSFYNNSYYDMVLYGDNVIYLLSKRGNWLFNSEDSSPVTNKSYAYNYYYSEWPCNDTLYIDISPEDEGIWTKILYNDLCKNISVKAWNEDALNFSKCHEPAGWVLNKTIDCEPLVAGFPFIDDDHWDLDANHPNLTSEISAIGQSFTTPEELNYKLVKTTFYLEREGSLNGNITAALYNATSCSGHPNSSTADVGLPLAISEPVDCTDISNTSTDEITFFFLDDQQYLMEANHEYVMAVYITNSTNFSITNYMKVRDVSDYDYPGNEAFYESGDWTCFDAYDVCFYVFGTNDSFNNSKCFGLAYWNADGVSTILADYDYIDVYKLNYSRDPEATTEQLENHSVYGSDGIPLMYFPACNYSQITKQQQLFAYLYSEWQVGNISNGTFRDMAACVYRNVSDLSNMESREKLHYNIDCSEPTQNGNQNDTVYYYVGSSTNMSIDHDFNTALGIQIDACNDGTNDSYDGATIAIDVDNDMSWDDNDIAINWYRIGLDIHYMVYNGTHEKHRGILSAVEPDMYIGLTTSFVDCDLHNWNVNYSSFLPALHRYSGYNVYSAIIPSFYLEKGHVGSGNYLNANDTFGLHIMSVDSENRSTTIWENWNESDCNTYTDECDADLMWDMYLNLSSIAEVSDFYTGIWSGVNDSQIQYWGHGRIGSEMGYMTESAFKLNITKTANWTHLKNTTHNNTVNYTVVVCNNGTLPLTNITVEDSLPNCCEYINSSLPIVDVTGLDRNWTFNVTLQLNASNCTTFNITVNFTAGCDVPSGTILYNTVFANCSQGATATAYEGVQYGNNTAPNITATYPVNGSSGVGLLLSQINATVEDANADTMDVYFFTNKTIDLDGSGIPVSSWHPIGTNFTVGNGTYKCNQIFDMADDGNHTRWRWGSTTYWFNVSVTDGKIWTNKTFSYTTSLSRCDVQSPLGIVTIGDAQAVWSHVPLAYDGIYDVQSPWTLINIADAQYVWSQSD